MTAVLLFLAGAAFIETFGYVYHRWIEHGEVFRYIKSNETIRGIIQRHWTHHVKNYPPENLRPDHPYVTEDNLSWYLPGAVITLIVLVSVPWAYTIPFSLGGWLYGLTIDWLHSRFHLRNHFLAKNSVFLYLQRIHDIHHYEQTKNFTIVIPLLDIVFGTYQSELPAGAGMAA